MIWNPKAECMSREEIEALQLVRLKETVQQVYEKNAHYRAKMEAIGLKPQDIQSLKDLAKMPFTVKDDLRQTYPLGMLAVDKSEVVRLHGSSGTTKIWILGLSFWLGLYLPQVLARRIPHKLLLIMVYLPAALDCIMV